MSPRGNLRPVAASTTRRRGVGMVRVSKEREGMVSPENQRYAIEQYAANAGIDIIRWIEGIDESGSRRKPAWWGRLDQGIEMIESQQADVLVVWRIDRTARNRLKWAIATDRIETAGGYIESSTEPNDRSPAGRFSRGLMAEHAAFMAESIGATWKETQERRVRHGLTPNGARHFGYTYETADGYTIDPVEGPILAAMYRAYIAGEAGWTIANRYTDPDARPGADGAHERYARWSTAAVLRLLDSGFGAGFVLFRGELHDGAHQPVISTDEWSRYLHTRAERRRRPRAERSPYLYSGFIYCHCGSRMSGRTDHGTPRYSCTASAHYARHPNASIAAHIVDTAVLKWLGKMRDELNEAARTAPRRPKAVDDPTAEIRRRISAVNARMDRATEQKLNDEIPNDSYQRLRARYEAERALLQSELTRHDAQATVAPITFVGDLLGIWADLPVDRRREALRLLIDRVDVRDPETTPRVRVRSALTRS